MSQSELERLEREYVEAGGDLSLLEARLRMSPQERFLAHEGAAALAAELAQAGGELRAQPERADSPPR